MDNLEIGDYIYLKPAEECVQIAEKQGRPVTSDFLQFLVEETRAHADPRASSWLINVHFRM